MKPIKTPGAISWAELQTSDPVAAASFYSAVFGWELQTMEMSMGPYTVGSIDGKPVAGIMNLAAEGIPTHWGFYMTVDDVDAVAKSAEELGASIIQPPFDAPEVGRMAVIKDPLGAVFSIIAYKDSDHEAHQREWLDNFSLHGAFSWFELRVASAEEAMVFYGKLFGWTFEKSDTSPMPYHTIKIGKVDIGGMMSAPLEQMPPHWGAYVTVEDIEAYTKTAEENGGKLMFPIVDLPGVGRFTMVSDPDGGVVAGMQYALPVA